ncbi:MAG: hypothetical protein ABI807_09145 [Sporichthyaceae bacterium]
MTSGRLLPVARALLSAVPSALPRRQPARPGRTGRLRVLNYGG